MWWCGGRRGAVHDLRGALLAQPHHDPRRCTNHATASQRRRSVGRTVVASPSKSLSIPQTTRGLCTSWVLMCWRDSSAIHLVNPVFRWQDSVMRLCIYVFISMVEPTSFLNGYVPHIGSLVPTLSIHVPLVSYSSGPLHATQLLDWCLARFARCLEYCDASKQKINMVCIWLLSSGTSTGTAHRAACTAA